VARDGTPAIFQGTTYRLRTGLRQDPTDGTNHVIAQANGGRAGLGRRSLMKAGLSGFVLHRGHFAEVRAMPQSAILFVSPDLDAARPCGGGLGQRQREYAILELRADMFLVHPVGQ
jgi:hypothetical protein